MTTPNELRELLEELGRAVCVAMDSQLRQDKIDYYCRLGVRVDEVLSQLATQTLQEPFELRLCEQNHTVLQPGRLYQFTVDPDCPRCVAIAEGNPAEAKASRDDFAVVMQQRDHYANRVLALEGSLVKKALELCDAIENKGDLPPMKYALRAGRLVNEVRDLANATGGVVDA